MQSVDADLNKLKVRPWFVLSKKKIVRNFTCEKFSCLLDSAAVSSMRAVFNVFVNSKLLGLRIISSISVLLKRNSHTYSKHLSCCIPNV